MSASAPLVAVSDTVFPNLDLAKAALSKVNAKLQLASEATPGAILDVATVLSDGTPKTPISA